MAGVGVVGEFEGGGVPFEGGHGEAAGDAAEEDGFSEGTGVAEVSGGLAFAAAGGDELTPVIGTFNVRELVVFELFDGEELRAGDLGEDHDTFGADEDGSLAGNFLRVTDLG